VLGLKPNIGAMQLLVFSKKLFSQIESMRFGALFANTGLVLRFLLYFLCYFTGLYLIYDMLYGINSMFYKGISKAD